MTHSINMAAMGPGCALVYIWNIKWGIEPLENCADTCCIFLCLLSVDYQKGKCPLCSELFIRVFAEDWSDKLPAL